MVYQDFVFHMEEVDGASSKDVLKVPQVQLTSVSHMVVAKGVHSKDVRASQIVGVSAEIMVWPDVNILIVLRLKRVVATVVSTEEVEGALSKDAVSITSEVDFVSHMAVESAALLKVAQGKMLVVDFAEYMVADFVVKNLNVTNSV